MIDLKFTRKSLITGGVVSAVGLSTLAGVGIVSAQSGAPDSTEPMSSLVQKIASKFNLNKDEVQEVFNEERTAHEADREKRQAERLQKLVDNGSITADQQAAIEAKIKEMKAERESNKDSMKDLTHEERKAKMDEKRTELEAWAKEQGIDLKNLRGVLMGGGHMRPGHAGSPETMN